MICPDCIHSTDPEIDMVTGEVSYTDEMAEFCQMNESGYPNKTICRWYIEKLDENNETETYPD